MRKGSFLIGVNTVLVSAAVVAGIWYVANFRSIARVSPGATIGTVLPPHPHTETDAPQVSGDVAAATPAGRTHQIIECHSPDIGRFWTNAASCDEADLYNRVSIAEPRATAPERQRYSGEGYQTPAEQAKSAQKSPVAKKPNLRLTGKSPPSGLNAGCAFAVGKALELERPLSAADNPAESIWRDDYCKWVRESAGCAVSANIFYYGRMCGPQ